MYALQDTNQPNFKMIEIMYFSIGTKIMGKITYNKQDVIGKGGQGTCIYK